MTKLVINSVSILHKKVRNSSLNLFNIETKMIWRHLIFAKKSFHIYYQHNFFLNPCYIDIEYI